MGLGPMGSSVVLEHDLLKGSEQFTIRRAKPVGSERTSGISIQEGGV